MLYTMVRLSACDELATVVDRTQFITLATFDVSLPNFTKSRVYDKVPERSSRILKIIEFPFPFTRNTGQVKGTLSVKNEQDPFIRFDRTPVCDRHMSKKFVNHQ